MILIDGRLAGNVQRRIDDLRDRLDFGAELLLDAMQIIAIFVGN